MEGKPNRVPDSSFNIYKDIQVRTGGEIYLGVVGPVRTGKSTFIKRFMDLMVLPQMDNEHVRERTKDELPQSAAGTTIMTTEPKFVPSEAAMICPMEGINVKVRLIDCVGFMVDGASGHTENDKERMVKTPWSQSEIPFTKAAEIGTKKVIEEHSTIGIVVTTDGSFSDIPREKYVPAEERTVKELSAIGKPYIVLLNSAKPFSAEAEALANELSEKYQVTVMPVNCDQLKKDDITKILESVLMEFPISEIDFFAPQWMEMLAQDHWLKSELIQKAYDVIGNFTYMKDIRGKQPTELGSYIDSIAVSDVNMSNGCVKLDVTMKPNIYYDILSELTGTTLSNEYELISIIRELSSKRQEFDKVKDALAEVNISGFGVVTPVREEISIEEPVVIKNGNKYGVKIKAQVPSINLLKTNINVEIAPIVGTKAQADDLIDYIKDNTKDNPEGLWETNIFGKTIEQIVDDGIHEKTHNMTPESMEKISQTLEKVMNENSGLVCLIV
jgi:stage IV sporulation protein A